MKKYIPKNLKKILTTIYSLVYSIFYSIVSTQCAVSYKDIPLFNPYYNQNCNGLKMSPIKHKNDYYIF